MPLAVKRETEPAGWRTPVWIMTLSCAAIVALFWSTIQTMVNVWMHSRTYAHGMLVIPACLYLIWGYRGRLSGLVLTPSLSGLFALIVLASFWLVANQMHMLLAEQIAVIAMLPGLVWTILGVEVVWTLLFPLGFLVFALPVGTSIEPALQDFTTVFIMSGLNLVGIPATSTGYFITLPSRTWEVARDCGGLRYVLPGLALGYLAAAILYRHWVRRAVFLLLCLALLMVANGLRAYGIIVGDYLGIADGTDHRVFSYGVYGATIPLLFWLGLKWREAGCQEPPQLVQQAGEGPAGWRTAVAAIGAVSVLALAPLSAWLLRGGL